MKKSVKKIGELLLERGFIDEFQLKSSLAYQSEWGGRLGSILIKKGFISEKDMARAIEEQFGLSCINLEDIEKPQDEVLRKVPLDLAKKFGVFPIGFEGKALLLSMADPTDLKTLDDIGFNLGLRIKPILALESDIMRAIAVYYEGKERPVNKARAALIASREPNLRKEADGERFERNRETDALWPSTEKPASGASQNKVIESLIELLVSKGIITKEELDRQIKAKKLL